MHSSGVHLWPILGERSVVQRMILRWLDTHQRARDLVQSMVAGFQMDVVARDILTLEVDEVEAADPVHRDLTTGEGDRKSHVETIIVR